MRWTVARSTYEEIRGACRDLVEKPEGKRQLGRPSVDGKIKLKWMFRKWNEGHKLD
jgi:hypothetical protein